MNPDGGVRGYRKRLASGTAINLLATSTTFVCGFLLTPFLLERLGDARYSLFVLAQSIVGFSPLLLLGVPSSLSKFMSGHLALGDRVAAQRSFSTGLALLTWMGGLAAVVVALIALGFPTLFPVDAELATAGRWVLIILGLQSAIGMPLLAYRTVFQATQRFTIPSLVRVVMVPLRTLVIVAVFLAGHGSVLIWALLHAGFELVQGLFLALRAPRVFPGLKSRIREVSKKDIRQLSAFSIWVLFGNIGFLLYYNTDYALVHWFVAPEQVVTYNLAARWDLILRTLVSAFASLLVPISAGLWASRERAEVQDLLGRSTRYVLLFALPACLLLAVFSRQILVAWTGPEYADAGPVMTILLLPLVLTLAQTPSVSLIIGVGKAKTNGLLTLGFAVLNVVLSIYFVEVWNLGLCGIALGTATTYFVRTGLITPWYACRIIDLPLGRYLVQSILRPILLAAPMVGVSLYLRHSWQPSTLPMIGLAMGVSALAFVIPAWRWLLDDRERGLILKNIRPEPRG